jgi:hypothetical protein
MLVWCFFFSHRYQHRRRRRRRRHHYIAQIMTIESSKQILEDRFFDHFKGWTWSERIRNINSWIWNEGYDI